MDSVGYLRVSKNLFLVTIVGLRCGFEGGVTTSVEFKSIPQKIFGPLILSCSDRFLKDLWYG